jgi:hypothetical protein
MEASQLVPGREYTFRKSARSSFDDLRYLNRVRLVAPIAETPGKYNYPWRRETQQKYNASMSYGIIAGRKVYIVETVPMEGDPTPPRRYLCSAGCLVETWVKHQENLKVAADARAVREAKVREDRLKADLGSKMAKATINAVNVALVDSLGLKPCALHVVGSNDGEVMTTVRIDIVTLQALVTNALEMV